MVQNLIYNLCESFIKNIDGIASITKNTPPLEEILAPATFEVTANHVNEYYWATFYTSMANYQAPDGVRVYKVNLNGSQFTWINIEDGIINKRQGVILRSSTSSITLTKTYSKSSDDYSNNSLIGTDYLITNPGNAYVLNYKQSHGLSFYHLSDTGRIKANAAYLVIPITYLTQWKIVGNSEVHTLPYPDIPQGYTKCKYLEFHGTEYIDSGVLTKNGIGFRCQYSTTEANKSMFGAQSSSGSLFLFSLFTTNTAKIGYGGASVVTNINTNPIDGNQHTLILDSEQCKIDNESIKFTRSIANLFYNVFIGTHNVGGNADSRKFIGKIYEFKLYDSNGNLFNGIPCLDDNDVPCLYDTVSGTSFYNDGTGTFGYEIEPQPTEIWSCGEYSEVDGKYHILVQPLGGSIVDIALDAPLRKVNDIADSIEFPSNTEGKALVTRNIGEVDLHDISSWSKNASQNRYYKSYNNAKTPTNNLISANILSAKYTTIPFNDLVYAFDDKVIAGFTNSTASFISFRDTDITDTSQIEGLILYELATPTTELVDAPQIAEADSYSMVISQGGKAVEWSSFETK